MSQSKMLVASARTIVRMQLAGKSDDEVKAAGEALALTFSLAYGGKYQQWLGRVRGAVRTLKPRMEQEAAKAS